MNNLQAEIHDFKAEVSVKIDAQSREIDALSGKIDVLTELVKTHCVRKVRAQKTPLTSLEFAGGKLTEAFLELFDMNSSKHITALFFKEYLTNFDEETARVNSKSLIERLKDEQIRDRLKTRYEEMTSTNDAKKVFTDVLKKTRSSSRKSAKEERQKASLDEWLAVLFSQLEEGCKLTISIGKVCTSGTPMPRGVGVPMTPRPKAVPHQEPHKKKMRGSSASNQEATGEAAKEAEESAEIEVDEIFADLTVRAEDID